MWNFGNWQQWATGWIHWLVRDDAAMRLRLDVLEQKVNGLMGIEQDIKSAFETYKSNVDTKLAEQANSIAALNAKIAALPATVDTAALQADLDEINAANAALVTPVLTDENSTDVSTTATGHE